MKTIKLHFLLMILIFLIINGCAMMVKVTVSEKRNPEVQQVNISENTTLTTWGTIKVNKSHFFPSSFLLRAGEQFIYFDPVKIEGTEKADYILLTHSHPDHFSLIDIKKILKPTTTIICSKGVIQKLKTIENKIHVLKPGDLLEFESFKLEAVAAYNTKSVFLWIKAHPKSKENVGYVLTLNDDLRIYHAGDTDYIPEMKELRDIDVALVPIGGDNLTMNEEEAARMINEIRPKIAIPMHYEIKNREELNRFESLIQNETEVKKME